jgi:hypothetical protein
LNTGQAIELAREWVEVHGSQVPGFRGAHLMGGLTYTPKDALFADYKDIDLNIVVQGAQGYEVRDLLYQGRILEYGTVSIDRYRSPEMVLSDIELASNLAADSILADPLGILAELRRTVAKEYSRRKWVVARCDQLKNSALQSVAELSRASSPVEALWQVIFLGRDLAGLVAVAGLRPPTNRRCFILMQEILALWGRSTVYEDSLGVLGVAHLSRAQAESFLHECAAAFDKAVAVTRTPIPYQFKLHAHVKPYIIEGTREMIDAGSHREAMPWIAACLLLANTAIQFDATEEDRPAFQEQVDRLASDLGLGTMPDVRARLQQAQALTDSVFKAADEIVSRNPAIMD